MQVTWTAIAPAPGSYAIERAIGAPAAKDSISRSHSSPGATTNFIDTTVQGGVTYTYRVIAATDAAGRCQSLVRSGAASAHRDRNLQPETDLRRRQLGQQRTQPAAASRINWTPATSSCPLSAERALQHLSRDDARLRALRGQPDCHLRAGPELIH